MKKIISQKRLLPSFLSICIFLTLLTLIISRWGSWNTVRVRKNFEGKKNFLGKTNLFTTFFLKFASSEYFWCEYFFSSALGALRKTREKIGKKETVSMKTFREKSFFLWIRMFLNDFLKVVFGEYSQNQEKIFLKFKKNYWFFLSTCLVFCFFLTIYMFLKLSLLVTFEEDVRKQSQNRKKF